MFRKRIIKFKTNLWGNKTGLQTIKAYNYISTLVCAWVNQSLKRVDLTGSQYNYGSYFPDIIQPSTKNNTNCGQKS